MEADGRKVEEPPSHGAEEFDSTGAAHPVLHAPGFAADGVAKLAPFAVLAGHTDRVWHVSWSPKREVLATCGGDCAVRLWAPATASGAAAAGGGGSTKARDGAAAGGGGGTDGGDASGGWRCIEVLDGVAMRTVRMCEWSPCGRYLATASFDGAVRVWEVHERGSELVATLEGHENEVKCVAWSADGTLLASCGRDKSVWVWDATEVEDGGEYECVSVLHGHSQDVKFVAFHPSRSLLLSASYDDTLKAWEEADDDWINTDTLTGHGSTVWQLAFETPGEGSASVRVASCSDDLSVRVWKRFAGAAKDGTARFKCIATVPKCHTRTIFSIDWSAQNGAIATSGADDRVAVHTQSSDSTDDNPEFHTDAVASHAHSGDVNCVRWHPRDGTVLATAGDDCLVRLWRYTPSGAAPGATDPAEDATMA